MWQVQSNFSSLNLCQKNRYEFQKLNCLRFSIKIVDINHVFLQTSVIFISMINFWLDPDKKEVIGAQDTLNLFFFFLRFSLLCLLLYEKARFYKKYRTSVYFKNIFLYSKNTNNPLKTHSATNYKEQLTFRLRIENLVIVDILKI